MCASGELKIPGSRWSGLGQEQPDLILLSSFSTAEKVKRAQGPALSNIHSIVPNVTIPKGLWEGRRWDGSAG